MLAKIVISITAAMTDSLAQTYVIFAHLGYTCASVASVATFNFAFMDSYRILGRASEDVLNFAGYLEIYDQKKAPLARMPWQKQATAVVLLLMLAASMAFAHVHYASAYFSNTIFLVECSQFSPKQIKRNLTYLVIPNALVNTMNVFSKISRVVAMGRGLIIQFSNTNLSTKEPAKQRRQSLPIQFYLKELFRLAVMVVCVQFASKLARVHYQSLSSGLFHYCVYHGLQPIRPLKHLLHTTLLMSHFVTLWSIAEYSIQNIIFGFNLLLRKGSRQQQNGWLQINWMLLWGYSTCLIRAHARAISSAQSMSNGYLANFLLQFFDKARTNAVCTVSLFPTTSDCWPSPANEDHTGGEGRHRASEQYNKRSSNKAMPRWFRPFFRQQQARTGPARM